jgi:hypothetical protein
VRGRSIAVAGWSVIGSGGLIEARILGTVNGEIIRLHDVGRIAIACRELTYVAIKRSVAALRPRGIHTGCESYGAQKQSSSLLHVEASKKQ